jgi:nucleolar MIF4G domain-containing protein 1
MRVKTSTTRLPVSLQEEITSGAQNGLSVCVPSSTGLHLGVRFSGNDDPNHYRIARHNTRKTSRKQARKQDRNAKKNKKAEYYAHGKKRSAEDDFEAPQSKKAKHHPTQNASTPAPHKSVEKPQKAAPPVASSSKLEEPSKPKPKVQTKAKTVVNPMKPAREVVAPLPPSQAEEEEDMNIKRLEKLLGYGKSSRKKAQEEDDGLDGEYRLPPLESLLADLGVRPTGLG